MFSSKLRIETYEFGPFCLDVVVRQLSHRGKIVPLSSRTFDILTILVERHGRVVTKKELISRVWLEQFVEENNLTVRISALRKALGEGAENRFIETVPGYGYRFVARVHEVFSKNIEPQGEEIESLAVLPFINEDNQQKLHYLCDGLTESLITSLSHIAHLRVMARSTVFRYKGSGLAPLGIGKELGVRAVLVGKVNQVNRSLIFDIELIDVEDGALIWSAKYRRQSSDLFTLQEELAREVLGSLQIKLSKREARQITKRYTDDHQAYHLYMKGRYFWNKKSVGAVKKAITYFRSAIRKDPQYSLAYAGLADACNLLAGYGLRSERESLPKAKAAAFKALEIDDHLAEAHVALANIISKELDWAGAEKEFNLAINLNPYHAPAHQYYSLFLVKVGRLDEALVEINKAYEIDPLSLSINLAIGKIYHFTRRYDDALRKGLEILEIDPQFGAGNGLIGVALLEMKRYQEAIREFKKMLGFSAGDYKVTHKKRRNSREESTLPDCDPEAVAFLGYAYARAGKRARAIQVLSELTQLSKERYVEPHTLALVNIGLGEKDKAFRWLDKALVDKVNSLAYIRVWPFFDSIRDDPRYEALLRRLKLPR